MLNFRALPVIGWMLLLLIAVGSAGGRVVKASQESAASPLSFELDIQPILTARGCNQGACHGKSGGQNGFQLSLFGFDPDFDFDAITKNARGRRIMPADPQRSLFLQKAIAALPHGGGRRLEVDGDDYATLLRWIRSGMPRRIDGEPQLDHIAIQPTQRKMQPSEADQIRVTAHYSDGSTRDVTGRTAFASSDAAIVAANVSGGFKAGPIPGEASIMARYMDKIAVCEVAIPLPGDVQAEVYSQLPRANFIDEHVWAKLQQLGITPSPPVDDAKFLRRVSIDIIGWLPTPDEVRSFLADGRADKRAILVADLLSRPEYADHWANKWVDLLRPNPYRVGIKAVFNYDQWIRDRFRQNQPYDQFVRDLITAQGSTWRNGAVTLFRDRREPEEIAPMVSQLFLGVRLECAKCHHHPFEKWSQRDFYSFAAYFARVGRKGTGLSPPISGGEEMVLVSKGGEVNHPITGEVLAPQPLYGTAAEIPADGDPRVALAAWMTAPDNAFFAEVMANRVWADLMGRGLVDPVDDLRVTNPPTNGPLLAALGKHFRDQGFDIKKLIQTICLSQVYSLSSLPGERNAADTRNHSRFYRRRLRAEVLMDAIGDITGVPDTFDGMPAGSRASQIWTHRVDSTFLDTFGRPDPNQDPPCERSGDSTVTQTLHLMNAPQIHQKITADQGRAAKLAASDAPVDAIVEEIYLTVYSRFPNDEEKEVGRRLFADPESTRRKATEDLIWALLNTPEFAFKD